MASRPSIPVGILRELLIGFVPVTGDTISA
jgi:hypothetical protein